MWVYVMSTCLDFRLYIFRSRRVAASRRTASDGTEVPSVLLMVGVNGTGKTTTVGKLARVLVAAERTVVLGAADTFRAARSEEHTSELQSRGHLVCRLLLETKNKHTH